MRNSGKRLEIKTDLERGVITSLILDGRERLASESPLFSVCLRNRAGECEVFSSTIAKECELTEDGAIYSGFALPFSVRVYMKNKKSEAEWRISLISEAEDYFFEWVDFTSVTLPPLEKNNEVGNGGKILFPYNEGAIIDDMDRREESPFCYVESGYPSKGSYAIFPNMICSQMLAYLWKDAGLYIGAHDSSRGPKDINFFRSDGGVTLRFRIFCGASYGESFTPDYGIVFSAIEEKWESAAERYREWFEEALPKGLKKIKDNKALPEWYEDSPLVVTYPVRGRFDSDVMVPNKLYPYMNVMPILEEIRNRCDCRLLVLLMHWEGTAPWAPPYVWEPFGGSELFGEFMDALHNKKDLLGVYCSGFGYTVQSNLIDSYNKEKEYKERGLSRGMCAGPDGNVAISEICKAQRRGYDICPASAVGKAILEEAYAPIFESDLDYIQILDQNHGGGQYFCYSAEHGHPPCPGKWMTENMCEMLDDWNRASEKTIFGCESAAAEPFIAGLPFSDNRFELNYYIGVPVPLYAFIYHEYVRNFMGNQVSCPFDLKADTLRYRIAYSFCAGDSMTLVLTENGEPASYWGMKDFDLLPDKEKALRLVANLTDLYKNGAKKYLYAGRMIAPPSVECEYISLSMRKTERKAILPVLSWSAWEGSDGTRALILVNPEDSETVCKVNGKAVSLPPLDGIIINM